MFSIQGILYKVFDTVQVSSTFQKREFVLLIEDEDTPKYNNYLKFQLTQKRCDQLDNIVLNCTIAVRFEPKGREHEGKFYTNLNALAVAQVSGLDSFENNAKTFH